MDSRQLQTLNQVLWRCAALGYVLVIVWFLLILFTGNSFCELSNQLFHITPSECALVNYAGIAVTKILVLIFFLFPWLAIRWLMNKQRKS